MKKIFRTWVDLWLLIPIGFALGIGSYWFVPFLLGKLGVPEKDMLYTGTAWIYSLFQVIMIFMVGIGCSSVVYKLFYSDWHEYTESNQFELDSDEVKPQWLKVVIGISIPAFFLFCFCLICLAVFQ